MGVESLGDLLLDAVEGTAADEEDVVGIDLNVVLIGVLASALGGTLTMEPSSNLSMLCCTPSPLRRA